MVLCWKCLRVIALDLRGSSILLVAGPGHCFQNQGFPFSGDNLPMCIDRIRDKLCPISGLFIPQDLKGASPSHTYHCPATVSRLGIETSIQL